MQRASLTIIWVRRERRLGAREISWNEAVSDPRSEGNFYGSKSSKEEKRKEKNLTFTVTLILYVENVLGTELEMG